MNLREFCDWLSATPISTWEKTAVWFIPTVQTIHILSVTMVISSAVMVNLRLLNLIGRDTPREEYVQRFEPWIWWPVLVLLSTGTLLTVAEPGRELINDVFRIKMLMLIVALVICWFLYRPFRKAGVVAEAPPQWATSAMSVVTMCLWVSIVFAGRWIAYVVYG